MALKFKIENEFDSYPAQIYFLEDQPHSLLEVAKKFDLPIVAIESNNNVILTEPPTNTIYVLEDFENHKMFHLIEKTPNTWILGPTALREIATDPEIKLRTKPTYCYFMHPFVFYINCPEDIPLMKRMVKLLKWMGGRFVAEPNFFTTHMITTSSLAKGYTYCNTFNVPIISPSWVEYCWCQRNKPRFDPTSVMEKFRISPFVNLHIAFKGFDSEKTKTMVLSAKSQGASVVTPDNPCCTHLVVSYDLANHMNIADVPHIPYVVNEGWFDYSIEYDQRAFEDRYFCFPLKHIRKSIWARMDSHEKEVKNKEQESGQALITDVDYALVKTAKLEQQDILRKYAFEDLHLKEKNYVYCLRQLLEIKKIVKYSDQAGGSILNDSEEKIIFGNLEKLVRIHEEFIDYFENVLKHWKNDAITAKPIIQSNDELLKHYCTYTNNFDESRKLVKICESRNKRFRKLLESSMKSDMKEHPRDIFIRPIQRLCSLVLQLQEIKKYTREDNPDKKVLNEAIHVVKEILLKINNKQDMVEKLEELLEIYRQIKNCPSDLITSYRKFIVQFPGQEVVSEKNNETEGGTRLMFFLFNDILEITKIRKKIQGVLMASDSSTKNLYEHIARIPLSMIKNLIIFEGREEDDQGVFGLTLKDTRKEGAEVIHCFQYSEKESYRLKDILKLLAEQLAQGNPSKAPKDFILDSIPITRISIHPIIAKPEKNVLHAAWNIWKPPTKKNQKVTKSGLRKSCSCGDLQEAHHWF